MDSDAGAWFIAIPNPESSTHGSRPPFEHVFEHIDTR